MLNVYAQVNLGRQQTNSVVLKRSVTDAEFLYDGVRTHDFRIPTQTPE